MKSLLEKMTVNPAKLLGLPYGSIEEGGPRTSSSSATRQSGP